MAELTKQHKTYALVGLAAVGVGLLWFTRGKADSGSASQASAAGQGGAQTTTSVWEGLGRQSFTRWVKDHQGTPGGGRKPHEPPPPRQRNVPGRHPVGQRTPARHHRSRHHREG
jgi:hypothetical protein